MVGTWTFDHTANVVTVTGGTVGVPCGFIDAWNADKAGTGELVHSRNIGAADGANVAVDHAERPTDLYVLGLADIFITITNFTANGSILITGTEQYGAAQTETIAFVGNGVYNSTKYWRTITHTRVTVYANTFTYTFTQAQWGVVWKTHSSSFIFNCRLVVGTGVIITHFTDTSKQVLFSDAFAPGQTLITVAGIAILTLGTLTDAALKTVSNGCSLSTDDVSEGLFFYGQNTSYTYLYGTSLESINALQWNRNISTQANSFTMYYCTLGRNIYISSSSNLNIFHLDCINSLNPWGVITSSSGTFDKISIISTPSAFMTWGNLVFSVSNVYVRKMATRLIVGNAINTTDKYLINVDTDTWLVTWLGVCTTNIVRQYTVNLQVFDEDGTALVGAIVTLKNDAGANVFSVATGATGAIAEQTVSRGYYAQATGDVLQDYGPFDLYIGFGGYRDYKRLNITLDEPLDWRVCMVSNAVMTKEYASMKGGTVTVRRDRIPKEFLRHVRDLVETV